MQEIGELKTEFKEFVKGFLPKLQSLEFDCTYEEGCVGCPVFEIISPMVNYHLGRNSMCAAELFYDPEE